jgi:hypothetical protein
MARKKAAKKKSPQIVVPPAAAPVIDLGRTVPVAIKRSPKPDTVAMTLADGTRLKLKPVVMHVERSKKFNPNGDPIYQIQTGLVLSVIVPRKLKRKVKKP